MNCYKIIDLEQGSDLWLDYRRLHVTASDMPILAGEMTWVRSGAKTPLQLYNQKVFGKEIEDNVYMQRGRRLEPEALAVVEEKLGISFKNVVVESLDHPWMMASLDGWNEETGTLVEIKCPMGENLILAQDGRIPHYWKRQGDYQMTVLGITSMYFFVYSDSGEHYLIPHVLEGRDRESCIDLSKEFFECLSNLEEPASWGEDFILVEDAEANKLAVALEEQIKNHQISEKILKELKAKVLDYTDDGNCIFIDSRLKISRCKGRNATDWKKLCKEEDISEDTIAKYTKQSIGYPRFTIGKEDE